MKNLILLIAILFSTQAFALRLEYIGETSIANGTKFEKTTMGGLSGLVWNNNTLYALSDDKGRVADVRFYEFDLKIEKGTVTLTPKAVRFITGLPMNGEKKAALDPEGLVRLADGNFIISSEGNNDAKPREMPRIFQVSSTGVWKNDLPMPDKYLPELTGKQNKGIQNNSAFEGLTLAPDGKSVFTSIESALMQDYITGEEEKGDWIRILKYQTDEAKKFKPAFEYGYRVDSFKTYQASKEVFRGVSEILALSDSKILVLERGVRISPSNIFNTTAALYLADLSKGTDLSSFAKLGDSKFTAVDKVKVLDFETDLVKERPGKVVQNLEALAFGPTLPDGRRTLLVMSDNNFSKKEITELIVFALEGE